LDFMGAGWSLEDEYRLSAGFAHCFRHPPACGEAAQTGGPSGARERDPVRSATVHHILLEQIAYGAAESPGSALRAARRMTKAMRKSGG
jgi:hypothetical protein